MTASVWDSPEMKTAGNYVAWENPGDTVAGTITDIRVHHWDDGTTSPQVFLTTDDGEDRTMTVSQMRLKAALVEQRPEVGDHIKVTFSQVEKRPGGRTLKHFDVDVTRGTGKPAAAVAPANGKQGFSDDPPPF